jgi:hypothetical protein
MSTPDFFIVTFEHAHRSFTCVRLDGEERADQPGAAHWIVTMAGRLVWSLAAKPDETRASVQQEVVTWWDTHGGAPSVTPLVFTGGSAPDATRT